MDNPEVELNRGWQWLAEGVDLLFKYPGQLVLMGLTWSFGSWLLGMIPFLGHLAALLLGPVMFGGLLYSVRRADTDKVPEFSHLFQGFQEDGRTISLITLGLVPLGAGVIGGIIAFAMGGLGMAALAQLLMLFAVIAASAVVMLSVPQVMFEDRDATTSIRRSLGVLQHNPGPVGILIVILIVASMLIFGTLAAMHLSLLIPILGGVAIALTGCSVYLAYRELLRPATQPKDDSADANPTEVHRDAPAQSDEEKEE